MTPVGAAGAVPLVFFGRQESATLLRAGALHTDDSFPFETLARTNRIAPAGTGGEVIVTVCYLTVRHAGQVTVAVTPLIDDARYATTLVTFPATGGAVMQEVREIGLAYPYARDGVERARVAPRGTWIQLEVEVTEPIDDVTIEQVDVEYDVVRESKQ